MSIHRMFRAAIAAASVTSAVACGPRISSDRDESIPVPRGATWAWGASDAAGRLERERAERYQREPAERYQREPAFHNEILLQRFHRALEAAMLAKGFRKVDDGSQADFLLTYTMGVMGARQNRVATTTVGVGFGWYGGGWGRGRYNPWGRGWYNPWGPDRFYPWGWGLYDPWACCWYGSPMWWGALGAPYPMGYPQASLTVLLRQRASGHVAWRGTYPMDVYETRRVSQAHMQDVANKLLKDLR